MRSQEVPGYACRWLDRVPDLLGLWEGFPSQFPYLLESAARGPLGAHSLLLYAGDQVLRLHPDSNLSGPGRGKTFFERLESWYQQERLALGEGEPVSPARLPFCGGWFIYLGYEMAAEIEVTLELPPNRTGLPDAIAHRCHGAVIIIHDAENPARDQAVAVAETESLLAEIVSCVEGPHACGKSAAEQPVGKLETLTEEDSERFEDSVARIHEYLLAGDVFQVNASRPWSGTFRTDAEPGVLYRSLRDHNPAPFAGMMRWRDSVMLSSSPERLVQVQGNRIQTRPIAGTRPRGSNEAHDRALSKELIDNLKERAEHIMLIDLERNDLGRVCRPGTVDVNELMVVESYAHVHHIVSNVCGELNAQASPIDAIKAVFPGGTITGCPKVRCMEIIAELEAEGRGSYTGSMGYLSRDGHMDLNILIRSMLVQGRRFSFRTGAGIVADSVPEQEVIETRDKARGMLLAIEPHRMENRNA